MLAPLALRAAALALAGVGITMNGWFARSLGSTDAAGYLFLAVGVAADVTALVLPTVLADLSNNQRAIVGARLANLPSGIAGRPRKGSSDDEPLNDKKNKGLSSDHRDHLNLHHRDEGQKASARRISVLAGWLVWTMTFAFALSASVGFASTNISDVTMARASRVTPQVTQAQAALADAMKARDLECKGGVGRFCRDREANVQQKQSALESALGSLSVGADPQAAAMVHLVTWVTGNRVTPGSDDIAMVRLLLLALLPQVGGILLMVAGRRA
jgi:hypothetical protein